MTSPAAGSTPVTYWPLDSSANPRFAGPVSFFRLPMLNDPQAADIALVGLPWDGGTANRAGTRHGPRDIHIMSTLIRPYHHVTRTSPYEHCQVADFGDAPVNPVDINDTLGRVEQFYRTLHDAGVVPVTAGADTGAQWTRLLAGGKRHSLTEMGAARRHLECHTIAMCSKHN